MTEDKTEKKHYNLYYIILEDMERYKMPRDVSERIKKRIFESIDL